MPLPIVPLLIGAGVAAIAYFVMTKRSRNPFSDAAQELTDAMEDATKAVKDATKAVKDATKKVTD